MFRLRGGTDADGAAATPPLEMQYHEMYKRDQTRTKDLNILVEGALEQKIPS